MASETPSKIRPGFTTAPPWQKQGRLTLYACMGVALMLAVAPLVRLMIAAFATSGDWHALSALEAITGRAALRASVHSLATGLASAALALIIGTVAALALTVTRVRGKRLIGFALVLSMLMAPQVVALGYLLASGPASPLLIALGLAPAAGRPNPMLGAGGIIVVLALHHAPLVLITVLNGIRTVPRSLVEAAQIDGASSLAVIWRILLPLLRVHLVAALTLAFVAAIGNFGIPAILGLPAGYLTLPTLIYQRLSGLGPGAIREAAALCLPVAAMAGAGLVAGGLVLRAWQVVPLEADQQIVPFTRPGLWRVLLELVLWGMVFVMLVVPLASLLCAALVSSYGVALTFKTLTFANFIEVVASQPVTIRALRNSLLYATVTAMILGMFAMPLAYALQRHGGRWRVYLEGGIEIPYALPGIVLAIAMILLFLKPLPLLGFSIYATPLIIIIAYLVRFLPLALKAPLAVMAQLDLGQEEAATVFGASLWQRLRHVVFPALGPAAVAAALLVFLTSFNELTVSALLWSAGTETLGVALFSLEEAGLAANASALAIFATLVIFCAMLVLDSLHHRLPPRTIPWRF